MGNFFTIVLNICMLSLLGSSEISCLSLNSFHANSFFDKEIKESEAFRVFISKNFYRVKQIQYQDRIERVPDINGDIAIQKFFNKEHEKISFKDFILEGLLIIDLNPYTGQAVGIRYEANKAPRTWQAGKHFIKDVSRFRFKHKKDKTNNAKLLRFKVGYLWRIDANQGLTSTQRKRKAIEYLRLQKR